MNKKIILLLLIIIVIIATLILMLLTSKKPGTEDYPAPTPFNLEMQEATAGAAPNTDPTIIEQDRESGLVIQMAQSLPYYGKNFSLYYDFNSNSFILHINPVARTTGYTEFTAFLNKNKIDSPSWITNIKTIYQSP